MGESDKNKHRYIFTVYKAWQICIKKKRNNNIFPYASLKELESAVKSKPKYCFGIMHWAAEDNLAMRMTCEQGVAYYFDNKYLIMSSVEYIGYIKSKILK